MAQGYKHAPKSVSLVHYHFIFCPKRRRKILADQLAERLEQLIRAVCADIQCDVLALEIMPDHVHLLVNANPLLAPHQIVRRIKARSSRILRKEFPFLLKMPSLWTRSYLVSTASNLSRATIQRYIAEQKTRE